jgi:hypothetical protein
MNLESIMVINVYSEDRASYLKLNVNKAGKKNIGGYEITPLFSNNQLVALKVD